MLAFSLWVCGTVLERKEKKPFDTGLHMQYSFKVVCTHLVVHFGSRCTVHNPPFHAHNELNLHVEYRMQVLIYLCIDATLPSIGSAAEKEKKRRYNLPNCVTSA